MSYESLTPAGPTPAADEDEVADLSFSLGLHEQGEGGSAFHMTNDPNRPHQRTMVTDRVGAVEVRCKAREVVHGFLGPDSDKRATLLVYDFSFYSKRARRILSTKIKFEFSGTADPDEPWSPEIYQMAPFATYAMQPTKQDESTTYGGKIGVGADFGLGVDGSWKWEKTKRKEIADWTTIRGSTAVNGSDVENGATWSLEENKHAKTGVPSFLRTALLLEREVDSEFQCKVKIEMRADWRAEVGWLFGSRGHDDPILFDPKCPPTRTLRKEGYDTSNLGGINLNDICYVAFPTVMKEWPSM